MTLASRLFLFAFGILLAVSLTQAKVAFARLPEKPAERSLLYWRYLCHGERQEESINKGTREFKCLSQNWAVRTPASSGAVKEIIDNGL